MILLAIGYCLAGLVVGAAAAAYEYDDGATPGSIMSAGAVGLFALVFWPVVVLVVLLGGLVRVFAGKEP